MIFKKKAVILSALLFVLALVYILTLIFDPERQSRHDFAWLNPSLLDMADGIEITGSGGTIVLNRKNNIWVSPGVYFDDTADYPVKQGRVDDILAMLSRKGSFPVRAASPQARESLGVSDENASRILVRGGRGLPLLDLLVGSGDVLGKEVYLRRAGKNEIYSGEDRFSYYTESNPVSWYDLRLFPPGARTNANLSVEEVQQADITFFATGEASSLPRVLTLRRSGRDWVMPGNESFELDYAKVEAWLRSVLEAEAEDFTHNEPAVVEGNITLWLGDGSAITLNMGPEDAEKRRNASVTGLSFAFVVSEWTANRLFRERDYFIRTN